MAGEPIITVVGNVGGDPELRFTPTGKAVVNFSVGSTPRVKDGDQWKDGTTTWLRCSAWDKLAENIAESITRGVRVIVQGRMATREYEHNGEKRTSLELQVDAIGPELRFATARVNREGGGSQRSNTRNGGRPAADPDPWATSAPSGGADPWAAPAAQDDEPPF